MSRDEFAQLVSEQYTTMEALYKRYATHEVTRDSCSCIAFRKQARRPKFCKHTIAVAAFEDTFPVVASSTPTPPTPQRPALAEVHGNLPPRRAAVVLPDDQPDDQTRKAKRVRSRTRSRSRMEDVTPVKAPSGVWYGGAAPRPMNHMERRTATEETKEEETNE